MCFYNYLPCNRFSVNNKYQMKPFNKRLTMLIRPSFVSFLASNRSAAKTSTNLTSSSKARTVSPVVPSRKDYDDDVEEDDDDDGLIESIRGDEGKRNRDLLTVGRKVKAMVQKFWLVMRIIHVICYLKD